jgi:hypothetical protein
MLDLLPFLNGAPIVFSPFGVLNLAVLLSLWTYIARCNSHATKRVDKVQEDHASALSEVKTKNAVFETRIASIESALFDLREGQRTIIQTMVANHNANIMTLYRSGAGIRQVRPGEEIVQAT